MAKLIESEGSIAENIAVFEDPNQVMDRFLMGRLSNEDFIYANGLRIAYGKPDHENAHSQRSRFRDLTPTTPFLSVSVGKNLDYYHTVLWAGAIVGESPITIEPPLNEHWRTHLIPVLHIPTVDDQEVVLQWDNPSRSLLIGETEIIPIVENWLSEIVKQWDEITAVPDHKKTLSRYFTIVDKLGIEQLSRITDGLRSQL